MKEKVTLRDTTMKAKSHWLELEKDGHGIYVCLRNAKGIIGDERTPIKPVVLQNLITIASGVIIKNGPLRFYRIDDEMRVSFNELESEEGLFGYDTIDEREFESAVLKIVGKEDHEPPKAKRATAAKPKKKVAPKKAVSRHAKKA